MPDFDPALRDHLREDLGDEAPATLERVFAACKALAARWSVEIEGWLPGGTCSLVLTGRYRAQEVVLRAPLLPWECEASLPVLRAFSRHGGVEVLRFDEASGAALMPRLRPGNALDLPDDEAVDACADLILRLRKAEGTAPSVEEYLTPIRFETGALPGLPGKARGRCQALLHRLVETAPPPRLLHGDLHHFNVLRDGKGWVAIDPEGVMGDPAYECAAFLRNPIPEIGDDPRLVQRQRRRILRFAERLSDPPARIWGWAMVRTAQSVLGRDPSHPWIRVAAALYALADEFEPFV